MVTSVAVDPDADAVDALIQEESEAFVRRQPRSTATIAEASRVLAGGATSNWQIAQPQAVWMSHGHGSHVWDIDGNEYVDMHGGYGASIAGHGHPAIVEAVTAQVARGTHFAQPTADAIWVAEELRRRYRLPLWRFANSGTEATMDAIHLMRALTGRDLIIKVEGCYHGHHDSVQVSVLPEADEVGPADRPLRVPGNSGIPQVIQDLIVVVPFNDLDAVRRALAEHPGQIAGMILEPVMMNAGIIPPVDRLPRGPGSAAARRGRLPDLRRGEDRLHDRTGRHDRPLRRRTRHRLPGQGARRRHLGRRDRRRRGGHVGDRRRSLRAGRHVQRQPARDGGRPGQPGQRPRRRRVRPARRARGPRPHRLRAGDRRERPAVARRQRRREGLRGVHRQAGAQLPRLPRHRRPLGPAALADAAQRRGLPAAVGQGRAVAALGAAHRRGRRPADRQLHPPRRGRRGRPDDRAAAPYAWSS